MLKYTELISAVKPKELTNQYKILVALYCANAHIKPVQTKAVSELINLHFAKSKRPKNISALLNGYSGLVDPAGKTPKYTWQLTTKGLDRIRAISGLPLTLPMTSDSFGIDIGIVCALEHPELTAFTNACGGDAAWTDISEAAYPHVYRKGTLELPGGEKLTVVSMAATSMGLTAAAIATTHLAVKFRPRLIVMVGIAAGTKGGNKQFGDVLVADPSVDYNSGKIVNTNGTRKFQPDPYPIGINARLRSVLKTYTGDHPVFKSIRDRWTGNVPAGNNRLHMGPLGAADQVIDDASRLVEIQDHWRKLIGIEMETYGVYRACVEAPEPKPRFVSFKAVCDFAAEKSDSWQDYAAFCAAQFTVHFLRTEWNVLWS